MPFSWDDANQKRLLLIIIHLTAPAPPKWDQVAPLLGEGCTGEAARQQFKNLKNKAKKEFGELDASANTAEDGQTAAVAAKKGGRGAGGGGGGQKRKKAAAADVAAEAEDQDDGEESPEKKEKKKKVKVKAEVESDG